MNGEESRPWLPHATSECPVEEKTQAWIEQSIRWFMREFGTSVAYRDPVLPTAEFLTRRGYSASAEEIEDLVVRLSELMQVDRESFDVRMYERDREHDRRTASGKRHAVGHFQKYSDGRMVISLDRTEATDRGTFTAIAVHELSHLRLSGEDRAGGGRDGERLTDLLTVYFGFGIFSTNAAMRFDRAERGFTVVSRGLLDDRTLNASNNGGYKSLGYLSTPEFGYAMACYSWIRGEPEPPAWAEHLNPGPRVQMERGLAYLRRTTKPPTRTNIPGN